MMIIKSKIPDILKNRNLNATNFHALMISGGPETSMSWPIALELATKTVVRDTMHIGNIRKVACALGVPFDDLIALGESEREPVE